MPSVSDGAAVTPNPDQMRVFLTAVTEPGEPFEIRIPNTRSGGPARLSGKTYNGVFTDVEHAVAAIGRLTGADAPGVYVTINRLDRFVLTEGNVDRLGAGVTATADADVTRIRHLYIDVDPIRPPKVNATSQQHEAAKDQVRQIYGYLRDEHGWPDPVWVGSSGSGAMVLYRVDLDPGAKHLVARVLKALGTLFTDDFVKVDVGVGNPARIVRIGGTVNAKSNEPTLDRPWSVAKGRVFEGADIVTTHMLEAVAGTDPPEAPRASSASAGTWTTETLDAAVRYDIPTILAGQGIGFRRKTLSYGVAYQLDRCLTSDDHTDGAAIIQFPSGAVTFTCRHDRCQGKSWQDAKPALGIATRSGRSIEQEPRLTEPPTDADWDDPIPLDPRHGPDFPVGALPPVVAAFVEAVAESTQTPVDMAAVVALGSLSAAAGGKYEVVGPTWTEPAHIQVVVVAEPGSKKSPVFQIVTAPLHAWQRERWPDEDLAIAKWESQKRVLERARDLAEKDALKPKDADQSDAHVVHMAQVEELHAHERTQLFRTRVILDDVTPEATVTHLAEQGGAVAVMSAESAFFSNIAGQYGEGPNLNVLLKGHAGDSISVDRKGRTSEHIDRACLTLCLTVQPAVLADLGDVKGFLERGGAARLLPAVVRDTRGYGRLDVGPVPVDIANAWELLLRHILAVPKVISPDTGQTAPHRLTLSSGAARRFHDYRAECQTKMQEGGVLRSIPDWGAKHEGAVLRIAGLLHVASVDNPHTEPIRELTMVQAIAIGRYFIEHALIMYRLMDGEHAQRDAEVVLRALRAMDSPISKRDLHQKVRGQAAFKRAKDLDPALELLEDYGHVKRVTPSGHAGRPSEQIYLNPRLAILKILKTPSDRTETVGIEDFEDVSGSQHVSGTVTDLPLTTEPQADDATDMYAEVI